MTTLDLVRAIRDLPARVAIVGAGGKTSLLFALASDARGAGLSALVTTTTRIRDPLAEGRVLDAMLLEPSWASDSAALPSPAGVRTRAALTSRYEPGFLAVAASGSIDAKLTAVSRGAFDAASGWDIMATEADGARGLSLKAPGPAEPVVPASADIVFSLVGLDCLGRPLTEAVAFRPELVAERAVLGLGTTIGIGAIARLAAHPEGCFKGAPPGAARVLVLNKLDRSSPILARALAREVLERGGADVVALSRLDSRQASERIVDFLAL